MTRSCTVVATSCRILLFLFVASAAGCEHPDPIGSRAMPIVNGTRDPQAVELTAGQILAIGWLHPAADPSGNFCSGTVVAPSVVVTARHCTEGSRASGLGFGIGPNPNDPEDSFEVQAIYEHRSADAAFLLLAEDATAAGVEAIAINTDPLSSDIIGSPAQAGGYGETGTDERGRFFATVYVEGLDDQDVTVDGRGEQGICWGDSGSGLIHALGGDVAKVLAVEAWGDPSCVDHDYMTRLDLIADWFAPILVGESPGTCGELDLQGTCDGDGAQWCDDGERHELDCDAFGTSCEWIDDNVGNRCTCGEIDYIGRCDGSVSVYCKNGELKRRNCSAEGMGCGYVDAETGYFCMNDPECRPEDEVGRCDGAVAIRCSNGRTTSVDCALTESSCAITAEGPTCVDATEPGVDAGTADGSTVSGDGGPTPGGGSEHTSWDCGCVVAGRTAATQDPSGGTGWLVVGALAVLGRRIRRRQRS